MADPVAVRATTAGELRTGDHLWIDSLGVFAELVRVHIRELGNGTKDVVVWVGNDDPEEPWDRLHFEQPVLVLLERAFIIDMAEAA